MRERGMPETELLAELDARQAKEPDIHGARLFGLVYPTGDHELERFVGEVYRRYLFGNALNPMKFREIARFEREVVGAVGELLHRTPTKTAGGAMTSGGTESILMSMLVHRARARARGIQRPEILAPVSAHPAYAKAAHYFDMDVVRIPLDAAFRADVSAARSLISERTAVVVASAFNYPYGVMDPVADLAALAKQHGAGCHVDACIGGFVLPFMERLGFDVPPWDFRVDGVTAISADVHKYGYMPKGASVVLHRDDDWLSHQAFLFDQWPSGRYGSLAMAGARPAAPIATAWAVINYLGIEGYTAKIDAVMKTAQKVRDAIAALPGVSLAGDPIGPVLAMRAESIDLWAVGDVMDDRGWHLNRNVEPRGLHMMLSPAHASVVDQLVTDLADAVAHHGVSREKEARYS